jgi:HNH endonuclease
MSVVSDAVRAQIVSRAVQRCEYCHLPTRGQVATFPVDHVIARTSGGPTELDNLALACPNCNGHKWKYDEGVDGTTGETWRLFNPRTDQWSDHFAWSETVIGRLEGRTPIGRATIARLQINSPEFVTTRELLASLGLFPEVLPSAGT